MKRYYLILLLGILLSTESVNAQGSGPTEYQVKAAFLYNFARFIEWPANTGTMDLCILGEDKFGRDVDEINGKTASGKVLSVRRIKSVKEIEKCPILFIASPESARLDDILDVVQGSNILTVGDTDGFAERGVIINFYRAQTNVRFEINESAAERAGLKISSKLFGLARIVRDSRLKKGD